MKRSSLWKAAFVGIYSFRNTLQSSGLESRLLQPTPCYCAVGASWYWVRWCHWLSVVSGIWYSISPHNECTYLNHQRGLQECGIEVKWLKAAIPPGSKAPQASCHGSTLASGGIHRSHLLWQSLPSSVSLPILICQCLFQAGRVWVHLAALSALPPFLEEGGSLSGVREKQVQEGCPLQAQLGWEEDTPPSVVSHILWLNQTKINFLRLPGIFTAILISTKDQSSNRHVVLPLSGGSSSQREWQVLISWKKALVFTNPPANSGAAWEISIKREHLCLPHIWKQMY